VANKNGNYLGKMSKEANGNKQRLNQRQMREILRKKHQRKEDKIIDCLIQSQSQMLFLKLVQNGFWMIA